MPSRAATTVRLNGAEDLERFVGETLDLLVDATAARIGTVFVSRPDGTMVAAGSRVHGNQAEPSPPFPAARCEEALRDLGFELVLPFDLDGELLGAYALSGTRTLDSEVRELLAVIAARVSIAFRAVRLARKEVNEERNRLAREMHDTVAQQLAAIVRQLEGAASTAPSAATMRHISAAIAIARDGLVDLRRSIRALRPSSLEGRTLDAALRDLASKIMRAAPPVAIRVDSTGERAAVPESVEDEIFGMAHEAIVNAIKHGAARTVEVDVAFEAGSVRVAVRDDGAGFDVASTRAGVGLSGMHERAQRIGAALTIASEPGSGAEVLVFWSGGAS
jgi:signal transduction histidine kinase